MNETRKVARTDSRREDRALRGIVHHASRWLGARRRWLFLSPLIAFVAGAVETVALIAVARLLVGFSDGSTDVDLGVAGYSLSLSWLALLTAGLSATAMTVRIVESRFSATLGAKAQRAARAEALRSVFEMPWQHQRSERSGQVQRMVTSNASAAAIPVLTLTTLMNASVTLAIFVVIIAVVAPLMLVATAVLSVSLAAIFAPLRRVTKRAANENNLANRQMQLDATTLASMHRDLELLAVQGNALDRLDGLNKDSERTGLRTRFYGRIVGPMYQQAILIGLVFITLFAIETNLTVSGVGAAGLLLLRSLSYVQQLNTATQTAIEALPQLWELETFLTRSSNRRVDFGDRVLDQFESLSLKDVSYVYPDGTRALDDVRLEISRGERLGLRGPSGGGKSSLVNLLVRLTSPSGGEVLVNGQQIDAFSAESWAEQVALVGQTPMLIRGTVADNVRLFRQATDAEVMSALQLAGIDEEIERLPLGTETPIGEGNADLSGGQRQRLAIARAMLKRPSLLVLDEPTSALDAESEARFDDALGHLDPQTTIIVVSHRPLLLERCSRVLEIQEGQLFEHRLSTQESSGT